MDEVEDILSLHVAIVPLSMFLIFARLVSFVSCGGRRGSVLGSSFLDFLPFSSLSSLICGLEDSHQPEWNLSKRALSLANGPNDHLGSFKIYNQETSAGALANMVPLRRLG
eukprot:GHVS01101566.1.p1 GENE.GHVS01101566.1~~GHVS01101566.1.p1  ORF type:complete len:111 (+),score=14.55 GHVS01101566.1:333-665(+)